MTDTERSLQDVARLQAEIMRERAEGLHESAQAAKIRLIAREEALVRLRTQVVLLKASLNRPPVANPAVRVEAPLPMMPVPRKAAAVDTARCTTTTLPRTGSWNRSAPYATIVACAVFLELSGVRRPVPAVAPNLTAPAVVSNARPAAKGELVVSDEDRSQEALLLVHEWKLPGDDNSLGDRLGGETDLPGGRPSWSAERTGEHGYRVTFQADLKDLPYAFEADIESRVVWPTLETQELLGPRFAVAFRDSVRQP